MLGTNSFAAFAANAIPSFAHPLGDNRIIEILVPIIKGGPGVHAGENRRDINVLRAMVFGYAIFAASATDQI